MQVFRAASTQLQLMVALLSYRDEPNVARLDFRFKIRDQKPDLFVKSPHF